MEEDEGFQTSRATEGEPESKKKKKRETGNMVAGKVTLVARHLHTPPSSHPGLSDSGTSALGRCGEGVGH
jgi:hypothetical protein